MALPAYAMNQASFPQMYERWIVGPLFRPFAEAMLDEVKLGKKDRVLDIATGTGIVARVARERLGEGSTVVGVDISPDMLAVARDVEPGIDWREGEAGALPLRGGEQFDVVLCQQGLQFFPDKAKAASEMRRALAKGGRLAVSTWRSDEEHPFLRELRRVAERHLGPVADARYGFGDAGALEALFRDAGFGYVRSRVLSRTVRFAPDAPFVRMNAMALVGMSAAGKSLDEEERKRFVDTIVSESATVVARHGDAAGLAFELKANLATATG